jgi:hypothetical protein
MPSNRLPKANSATANEPAAPDPIQCIVGETVRNVRVWTEDEWARLDPEERPTPAEYFPGLGWVGAERSRKPC